MNYNDIVRLRYPNYILTYVGTGDDYYALQWNEFNPSPNPIPKATLDSDIADAIASGIVGSLGDLGLGAQDDLAALANLDDDTGLVKKIGHSSYSLDKNIYLTTVTGPMINSALGYIPYDSANPSSYTTKSYVDNLVGGGVIWQSPVHAFNFVGTASAPPLTANNNENYIINNGGNVGAWSSFNPGDRVSWINGSWVLREVTIVGCRLGVCFDQTTTGVGVALGKDNYIGEIIGGDAINGWQWTWTSPQNNFAVFNNLPTSTKFGESYTYVGSENKWIPFSSNTVVDGNGLLYSGNNLNVNVGKGMEIVSDKVSVNLHPTGGIITSLDGFTSSSDPAAGLALATIGTPGTYTKLTVDAYGRITIGENPTTLSGYSITDAVNTNSLGTPSGVATLDSSSKLTISQLPSHTHNWSNITSTPNTLSGYGIIDAQHTLVSGTNIKTVAGHNIVGSGDQPISIDDLSDAVITTPLVGQVLVYNGTSWANLGDVGQSNGGGAAKRIWSNNVAASTGTTIITPGVTAPTSTQGTQLWTLTITPYSTSAVYEIQSSIVVAGTTNNSFVTIALFRNNVYIGGSMQIIQSSNNSATLSFSITDIPNTTSPVTYQVRVGISTGTWYINRRPAEVTYGGLQTGWVIWEY